MKNKFSLTTLEIANVALRSTFVGGRMAQVAYMNLIQSKYNSIFMSAVHFPFSLAFGAIGLVLGAPLGLLFLKKQKGLQKMVRDYHDGKRAIHPFSRAAMKETIAREVARNERLISKNAQDKVIPS